MKKIIVAGLVAGILSIGFTGLVRALLRDVESSHGNLVSGATINLQVGDSDPSLFTFGFENMVPGEMKEVATNIASVGGLAGNFSMQLGVSNSSEGDNPEPETDITGDGELEECAEVSLVFGDGLENRVLLDFTPMALATTVLDAAADTQIDQWVADGTAKMRLLMRTDACGPEAMGDQFEMDLMFFLDQV